MVTNLFVVRNPSVDVNMLELGAERERWAEEHVVQLLIVAIENIRVSLQDWDATRHVGIDQSGNGLELLDGVDNNELVHVTGHDDLC